MQNINILLQEDTAKTVFNFKVQIWTTLDCYQIPRKGWICLEY